MNHEFDGHRDLVTQIKEIDHYYQSLSIEVDNRALNLTAVDCLSLPNHSTALSSSTECPEAVSNAWNWLEKAAKCLQTHLANAANYHKFFHESRHLSSSLPSALTRSKQLDTAQYRLNRHEECIRKIIEEIKEILENLLQIQAKVDILCDQSDAIVPVHLRKLPVTAPLPIVALTSYSRNQIRIDENVSYVLLDNTDPEKWKVKTGDDTTAILPSLIFIIPPPDSEAVQTGSRLRQQFLSTWKTCASVLKFHARTVLSQYLSGHNKRELNYLNKEQITFISECLGEALALLMDNKAQTNDVLDFKKMTDDWTQSISALKPSSNDNRNMTNRLQDDWTVNKKLLRQIQEFEAFVKSYEEDQSSLRAMKQKLIKGDISNLKYVSVAYIESWPKKRFGGPVEDGTPGSSRLIMSEKGPRHSGRYVSQLEAELEEFMSETIMQDQEVSEVTSQTIQETKRFMIRGVIDPRTSQEISIYQAIADKVINHHQGLYRNLVTGESIPIPEAMDRGLILVEYINRSVEMGELIKSGIIKTITSKETVSYHVLSIKDPTTGLKISVSEALRRGIVDPERSRYVINSKTGEAISIPTAIDKGFLEVEVIERKQVGGDAPDGLVNGEAGKDLLVEGVYDPLSRKTLTLNEAVGRGVIDLERGAYFNPVTKDGMSIEEAIQRGYLSVRLADPNARDSPYSPLLGRRMTAVNGRGVGDFEQMVARKSDILMAPMRVSIEQKVRGLKELEARHVRDPSTGKKLTVAEAMDSGLLSLDPLGFTLPDGKKCTIFEAAQQGLIDPQTTKEILKLLEPHRLERYISDGVIDAARGQYVDPTTGERMSLAEAVSRGKLDAGNIFYTDNLGQSVISLKMAAANNRFDLETGQVIDPLTGKKLTLAEAIGRNLINPDVDVEEMSARLSSAKALDSLFKSNVRGIKNPQTGQEISLEDAVYEGILDATKAEFVHPVTKKRIPLTEAAALGLVSPETTKKILDSMSQSSYEDLIARKEIDVATGKFIDPETKRKISMKEAIAKGYLDPGSIYLFDISENRPVSLSTLIAQGKFNPETGKFRDPSSGSEMSVTAAVKQGTVATRFGAEDVVDGKKALQDLLDSRKLSQNSAMFVLPSGDLVPLKEALANGLVSSETAVKLDQKTGNVVLADGSDAVVQALTDTNSRLKFVNEIESQISRQPPVSDNVNDLRQAIPTIEGLKGSLECERKDIEAVLANAQRLVDADKGSPQQNQRLKCNTTDLRMRFEEANVQLDGRLSRLKSLIGDLTHLDNDCRQLGGWTERRNEELDEFRRKLKTASDFEAVKNHLKDFNEELQREEAILQKVNSDGKKVTDAIKECNRNARKYLEGLENQSKTSLLEDSFSSDEPSSNVQAKLDSVSDRFLQVGDNLRQLDAQLERVAASEEQYRRAKSELEHSLPELKRRVDECRGVTPGSNERDLQEAVERIKEVTGGVMEAGKQMKELREAGDSLVQVLDRMSLGACTKAKEVRSDLERVQDAYDRIQGVAAERQRELNKAVVQTQDANQNLVSLLQWVEESEAYLDRSAPVSLDRARLASQLQEHRSFSSELESRRPRVGAVVDQCQAQGGGDRRKVDELLDRFDALRSRNEARGNELEDVVRRLTELHSSVDQMESWLTAAVHSLKRSGSSLDQNSLRAKIEGLYVQKQGKQPDLEKIKTIGRELIDDPVTGDKHHLREMIADMQGKWQDLTELLVQMISYSALTEIDELLKYLDRAENEMNTADAISIDPEALAVQLRDHKTFHDDLKNKRRTVSSTIDKCNLMLLETTNEEADDIKHKLNIIRDQADLVFRLSSERCSALEEALPLVSHFCDTRTDLQSWLNEMEAEVNSMEVEADGTAEQVRKQLENAKNTLRIIDDHRALMQDLVATGQDLVDICGEEDGHDIRQDLQDTMVKYNDIKATARHKMNTLKEKLRSSTQELSDGIENLAEELYYINDQIQHVDPISIKPPIIQEQMAECRAIMEDLEQCATGLDGMRGTISHLQQQEPNENTEDYKELTAKLQELESLYGSIQEKYQTRALKLDDAIGTAEKFQYDYLTAMQNLQGVKDNLLSQDVSGIDPSTVREQQKELQAIRDDLQAAEPLVDVCRKTADKLGSICGGPGTVEIQKHLEDMDGLVEDIQDGVKDRDTELGQALERSENCSRYHEAVHSWLPKLEGQLNRMSPPAADAKVLQAQIAEVRSFKANALGRRSDVANLNQYAAALKNASPITAESLVAEVKELSDRWYGLLGAIGDRERALNLKLIDSGSVDVALDGVVELLTLSQEELADIRAVKGDGKALENALKNLQVVQVCISTQEPLVQRLNDVVNNTSGSEKPRLQDRCQAMNGLFNVVQVMARDEQNVLQDRLKEYKAFMGSLEELLRWMNGYRATLVSCPPLSALPDGAEQQHNEFMEGYEELEKKEGEVKAILLTADDLWGQSADANNETIREAVSALQDKTYGTRAKAERRKRKVAEHLRTVHDFNGLLRVHTDWLNNAEKVLGSFKHPSKLVDRVVQQMNEHKSFRQSLDQHTEMMSEIEHLGAFLKFFGGRQDNIHIQTLLMTIKVRWKKLVRRVEEKGRLLNHAYQEDKRFYDEWKSVCDWIDANEQRLRKYTINASAKVKQDIDELQHFQQQLLVKQSAYHSASRLGRNLKDRCTKVDPEREVLHQMLEELKNKWNGLRSVITQRQSKLDQALLSSGRFSEAINTLMEWLGKAEVYLMEDQPVLGDLDTVTILTEHHKAFQQELMSRQAMMEAIRASVGDEPNVNAQLGELNALWDRVNHLSDARDYRLLDALKLAEEFQEVVQVVREWLPLAEAELKFRAMPEDEDSLVQLLENHERFQEDLRAQQPNIEKIAAMADEILRACHPSAVRFVRYYLTITQTRWEQAVNRSNQRLQRLQEALRNMRGNAALLEELLSWLMEAHALLTAKEKDPIPDDLTVVEVLVREHLEFHEDLCMKNKDVERLTKAPPSTSRLQLHGSAWKLNELDTLSPRVVTLQNKWRTVWRISVDRKKRLQDTWDQLLELESFKNFDFDHWRQRYVDWIKSKKLRVTDFFRRQDRNGYGTLTRDQFVSGMLISKFPTNKTELNAVFDIFDRNRTGEIPYLEFIDALRPERQHGGRRIATRGQTDSEMIHNEIEQQTSRCQCRHQFFVERFGEGKYKFGEKGKLCLVRYLNSTVMVRVGGGWVTLSSFLENNDPCRAKGRLNTDLREALSVPDVTPLPGGLPRRSIPSTPALDNRLSGSTSSLSSVGKSSTKGKVAPHYSDAGGALASKRGSNVAKSCSNLTSGSAEANRPGKKSSGGSTTPHSTPRSVKSGAASSRPNGTASGRVTPTPSGARTPTASKTPSGSRSGSPAPNRRGGTLGERNPKPTNVRQNRF